MPAICFTRPHRLRHALPPERQPPARRAAGGALPRRAGAVAAAEPARQASLHARRGWRWRISSADSRAAPRRCSAHRIADVHQRKDTGRQRKHRLCNLSYALRLAGGLREADAAPRRALSSRASRRIDFGKRSAWTAWGWRWRRGAWRGRSESALRRVAAPVCRTVARTTEELVNSYLAQRALWFGDPPARPLADRAWELARTRHERDVIEAARRQGEAALGLNDYAKADERLHHALARGGR